MTEMKARREKGRGRGCGILLCLAICILLAACASSEPMAEPEETAPSVPEHEKVMSTDPAECSPQPDPPGALSPEEMLQLYRTEGMEARESIDAALVRLRGDDPAAGNYWSAIFEELFRIGEGYPVQENTPPAGLPEDDSLGIVVFGYCLRPDGSMSSELIGRCEAALKCAREYPNARIIVTGGPTASDNPKATEARNMAWYLTKYGVEEERIILEQRSLSTTDNALFVDRILSEQLPQVRSLVIVSSSYHVPLCALLMTETAMLRAAETGGGPPYEVAAGMGFPIEVHGDYESPAILTEYVRMIAAPCLTDGSDR